MELGVYQVKVNYYEGVLNTSEINLRVRAGSESYSRKFILTDVQGEDGDSNPGYYFCDVVVESDSRNGGVKYAIVDKFV